MVLLDGFALLHVLKPRTHSGVTNATVRHLRECSCNYVYVFQW